MRVMYRGMDGRTRVSEAIRFKFLEDGFKNTDSGSERDETVKGPVIIVHLYRNKGGKRIILEADDRFNMMAAEKRALEDGWLDLSDCVARNENLY